MFTEAHLALLSSRSILALLFDQREIPAILQASQFTSCKAGHVVLEEKQPVKFVAIPLSGEVELYTSRGTEVIVSGLVQPGRTINTYSVLRGKPYQYSARFRTDGELCVIPLEILQQRIHNDVAMQIYLLAMTEDHDLRSIAKEIESLGCSKNFKVNFIASLQKKECDPQEWILAPGEVPSQAFYLVDGQLVTQRTGNQSVVGQVLQWQVPARTWVSWKNLLENTDSKYLLKSISNSTILTLSKENFERLQAEFPEDMNNYSESITSGRDRTADEDEGDGEEIDLDEVIRNSKKVKRYFWQSYPWIRQSDQMDCGPACMAMISQYYDHKVSIQFWRNQLSTNREGTSLYDLAQTGERCGFTSYALGVDDLKDLDHGFFPAIALRQYHYLVVYEVTPKHVIVGDPGIGIRKMEHEEFNLGFEQAVLFLKPTEKFFTLPEPENQYGHYFGLINGLGKEIGLNFLVSLMLTALGLFTPILSQVFLDDILVRHDMDLLKLALGASAVIVVLEGFLGWTRVYYANYLATKFDFKTHSIFIKKMLSLPYKFFADRHVGDFTNRLSEVEKVRSFILNALERIILSVLSLLVYTVALFVYSPTVAITVFAATPMFFLISWATKKKLTALYQVIFKEGAELSSNLTDTVKGIATIKSLGADLASRWRYEEKFVNILKARRSYALTSSSIGVFAGFYSHAVNFMLMGLTAYMAIKGELTPGQVVAVTMIAGNILGPMTSIASEFGEMQEVKAVFDRLNDILLSPSEKTSNKGRVKKENLRGEIEFKDVWFRYGGESSDWVLKGVSFKIEAGQNVAFVGPSGSGKSTLAHLLTRMYEPTKGQIFIDGRDYLDYDIDWYRQKLGILHQESHLFHGPIFENIAYADPNVDMNRVQEAAKKAAADDFISKKTGDYNYMISAGGLGLSGGEKQRISLARTFYREPNILVLDEATSALDGIAENKLIRNLKDQASGMTIINIAHRFSTVKHSDFVLVLFEGKMAGFGTHEDLKADNEIYQALFLPQIDSDYSADDSDDDEPETEVA